MQAANVQQIVGNTDDVEHVMTAVDGASLLIDDLDNSLGILDLKLKHMRADITAIEARNNSLQVGPASEGAAAGCAVWPGA